MAKALADPEVTGMKGKTPEATLYDEAKKPDGAVILVERGVTKARPLEKLPSDEAVRAARPCALHVCTWRYSHDPCIAAATIAL